jgi:hypothetical protein
LTEDEKRQRGIPITSFAQIDSLGKVTIDDPPRDSALVNVNTGAEGAFDKALGGFVAERVDGRVAQAQDAITQNVQLDRVLLAMSQGAETGFGSETILNLKSFGQNVLGLEFGEDIGEQEVIRKVANEMALRLRNPDSGIGLTGNTSNQDLAFLKASVIGLQRTPAGNRLIIRFMRRQNEMKIALAQEQQRLMASPDFDPRMLDSQLMEFANNYQFFDEGEREEIERVLNSKSTTDEDSPESRGFSIVETAKPGAGTIF